MALEFITQVVKIQGITSTQKLILFCLANYSSEEGTSFPSHSKIAEITCLSRNAVLRNLNTLKELGLIDWKKNGHNKTSNLYKLLINQGGVIEDYMPSNRGIHNTKEKQKKYILELENIDYIYKEKCNNKFFVHEANVLLTAETRWSKLKELGRRGLKSPKTGKCLDLAEIEFWNKYFEIANSKGYIDHLRGFMSGKPTLRTLLSQKQFNVIIERRYA
jgi:DNA-binding MarR family transcriptional regulator